VEVHAPQLMKRKGGGGSFSGTGHKLGDEATASTSETASGSTAAGGASARPEIRDVVLRLWSTGFTVDGGQLRSYNDPANLSFLDSVKRGEVPRELIQEHRGQEVSMTMEDRRTEDYVPPRPSVRAFAGKGNMLGR
jgi:UBX domain-containing protein 1